MLLKSVLLFGGKGGVGKSTLSCATALRLSERGRTILLSLDPAHSLRSILGTSEGSIGKLSVVELNAENLAREYTDSVLKNMEGVINAKAYQELKKLAHHISSSPTAIETAVLDRLSQIIKEDYHYVVLDFAPTGQMLRLFKTFHVVREWVDVLIKLSKDRERVDRFMGREMGTAKVLTERRERIELLIRTLEERGMFLAVANEDKLSLEEAERLKKELNFIRCYMVINKWEKTMGDFLKVAYSQNPYGVKALEELNIDDILSVV
ncbi:MAG: ArsA family ATPase [Aquificaceae bacterium]